MGAMGRYIDSLPDGARDRLVEADEWIARTYVYRYFGRNAACLLGHALNLREVAASAGFVFGAEFIGVPWPELVRHGVDTDAARVTAALLQRRPEMWDRADDGHLPRANPAGAFNRAVERFGLDRVVRAIKARAGAKIEIGEHTPQHVGHVK